jgi:tetratricopeptide (TPR) repeat protein
VDDALEVRPHSAEAWERRATLQARRGLTAEARASYARALELSPTHPRILRNLARLEWIQGDLDSGRAALERLRAGGCLSEPWLRSVGVELVLVLGRVERGARLLFDRPLSALSPDELHARARGPAEPPATELAPHAQHLRSAEECLAQLLWARQHAAAGDYASAARSYRQAAAQSLAVRGREPGPAAALLLEQAAAEARAGREPEARALLARARGSAEDAELPPWAREALAGLGWPGPP